MLAPEPLIAALAEGETYWFVGASGTSYAAQGALGRFERSSAPVEALTGVSAAGSAIVGVRQQRSLLRSGDFGISWAQVGPPSVAFVDVALEPSGSGLALAVPEALYRTQDHGATWSAAKVPKLGVLELEVALDGAIRALTPLGERRWDGNTFVALKPGPAAQPLPDPPRGPDAGALADGRAALAGTRYLELAKVSGREGWQLLRGPIEGPLAAAPLAETAGCRTVRLAAFERFVVVACFRGPAAASGVVHRAACRSRATPSIDLALTPRAARARRGPRVPWPRLRRSPMARSPWGFRATVAWRTRWVAAPRPGGSRCSSRAMGDAASSPKIWIWASSPPKTKMTTSSSARWPRASSP
jgi:hypothetical protein